MWLSFSQGQELNWRHFHQWFPRTRELISNQTFRIEVYVPKWMDTWRWAFCLEYFYKQKPVDKGICAPAETFLEVRHRAWFSKPGCFPWTPHLQFRHKSHDINLTSPKSLDLLPNLIDTVLSIWANRSQERTQGGSLRQLVPVLCWRHSFLFMLTIGRVSVWSY